MPIRNPSNPCLDPGPCLVSSHGQRVNGSTGQRVNGSTRTAEAAHLCADPGRGIRFQEENESHAMAAMAASGISGSGRSNSLSADCSLLADSRGSNMLISAIFDAVGISRPFNMCFMMSSLKVSKSLSSHRVQILAPPVRPSRPPLLCTLCRPMASRVSSQLFHASPISYKTLRHF